MKKKLKYLALIGTIFTLTSCSANNETKTDLSSLNLVESQTFSFSDIRSFHSRSVDRRKPSGTVGKWEKEDYPYPGHPNKMDYKELFTENTEVMNTEKQNLLQNKTLNKYVGSYKLYNGVEIPDSVKAVDMTFSYNPNGFYSPVGLYAAPGEIVDVYIPYEYKDKLFSTKFDENGNFVYTPQNVTFAIGLQGNNDASLNFGQNVSNQNTIPIRNVRYSANEIFKFNDTVVIDGTRYFHGQIGSPVGGPIYVKSNFGISFETRFIGAIESFYFANGITTNDDWLLQLERVKSPYMDLVADRIRLSGPALPEIKNLTKMEEVAYFWNSISAVSNYFGNRGAVSQVYDYHIPAGAAVAFVNQWFSLMPVDWFMGALNYDNLMNNGAWGDIHEFNHHHEFYGDAFTGINSEGNPTTGWDYYVGVEIGNNVLNGIAYSLYTNIAQNRSDDTIGGGLGWWETSSDPYSTLYKVYKSRFNTDNQPVGSNLNTYLSIFHSIGMQYLKDTRQDWTRGLKSNNAENQEYLYTMLSRKTGFDFYSFLYNTLKWKKSDTSTFGLNEESKNRISGDICYSTTDPSYEQPCNYVKFASTSSIYTMANQRVTSIQDFKDKIDENLKINKTWPVNQTEEQILDNQKIGTGYKNQSYTFYSAAGDSGKLYQDKFDQSVYKLNQTGRPYKVSSDVKTLLNFNFNLDKNNDPIGRLISTEEIESVELVYQQGQAIVDKGNYTYEFDPKMTDLDYYPFAVGIAYKDKSIKDEILYGKLVKNGSEITTEVLDLTNENIQSDQVGDLLKEVNYSYDSIKNKYKNNYLNLKTNNSSQPGYSLNENVTKTLAVSTFDFISPTTDTYQFQIKGDKHLALVYKENGTYKLALAEEEKGFNSFDNEGQQIFEMNLKENQRVSFYLYSLNNNVKNTSQAAVGFKQKPINSVSSSTVTTYADDASENPSPDDRKFQIMSGTNVSSIGREVFNNSKEVYPVIFSLYNYQEQSSYSQVIKSYPQEIKLVGQGKFTNVSYVPESLDDYEKNAVNSSKFNWDVVYNKKGADYLNTVTKYSKLTDGTAYSSGLDNYNNMVSEANFSKNTKVIYYVIENTNKQAFNYFELQPFVIRQYQYSTLKRFDLFVGDSDYDPNVGFDLTKFELAATSDPSDYYTCMSTRTINLDKTYTSKYLIVRVSSVMDAVDWQAWTQNDVFAISEFAIGRKVVNNSSIENYTPYNYYGFQDANVKVSGNMQIGIDAKGKNGYSLISNNADGSAGFTFIGSKLSLLGRKSTTGGLVNITVDGKTYNFTTYSNSTQDHQLLFSLDLGNSSKTHTVKIENVGGKTMRLQSLLIVPGSETTHDIQLILITFFSTFLGTIALTIGVYFLIKFILKIKKNKQEENRKNELNFQNNVYKQNSIQSEEKPLIDIEENNKEVNEEKNSTQNKQTKAKSSTKTKKTSTSSKTKKGIK